MKLFTHSTNLEIKYQKIKIQMSDSEQREDLNSNMSSSEKNEESDDESDMSEVESVAESIKEGMPESLDTIFAQKLANDFVEQKKTNAASLFTKSRHEQVNTLNVQEAKKRKAEELFQKHSLFASGKIAANAKSIKPLNNVALEKKERAK